MTFKAKTSKDFFNKDHLRLLSCLALAFNAGSSVASGLEPGEYINRQAPWHTLTVKHQPDGSTSFSIASMAPGRYACYVAGKLLGNRAIVPPVDVEVTNEPCNVSFIPRPNGIDITSNDNDSGSCSSFCAYISRFDGLYSKLRQDCWPSEVAFTRTRFRKLYAEKAYKQALHTLQPLLRNCEADMWFDDVTWVRNDLAMTYYHLGDIQSCRKVLASLESDARTWEGIDEAELVGDKYRLLPMMKATLFNLKLCGANSR
ncbi:MAG TPA: hypothetical protein VJ548_14530 [Azospira sp.]|nr:hypothetical protein [Azospira sp.]